MMIILLTNVLLINPTFLSFFNFYSHILQLLYTFLKLFFPNPVPVLGNVEIEICYNVNIMRRARLDYPETYHHVMSRGHEKKMIFKTVAAKQYLLDCIVKFAKRNNMKILAWVILDNHFHIVLFNENGKLAKFMKEVNGSFGIWYRKYAGGKGVVFDGRFKSSIIENDEYLLMAILYLYKNPVRANIVNNAVNYSWSSLKEFWNRDGHITDIEFLREIIGDIGEVEKLLIESSDDKITPFSNR